MGPAGLSCSLLAGPPPSQRVSGLEGTPQADDCRAKNRLFMFMPGPLSLRLVSASSWNFRSFENLWTELADYGPMPLAGGLGKNALEFQESVGAIARKR